jgi:hypothetical protein
MQEAPFAGLRPSQSDKEQKKNKAQNAIHRRFLFLNFSYP